LIFLWLNSPDLAVQRVGARVSLGGHHVPEEIVRRCYRNGVKNFFERYQPLADTWGIYDNSGWNDLTQIAIGVREIATQTPQESKWRQFSEAGR